jgi:S1-C subfamily serine protease
MVDDPQKLERELLKLKPQDKLKLKVQRGPRQIDLTVGLEELPPKLDQLPPGII